MKTNNCIEVKKIQKTWPDLTILGDFSIPQGKILALTGPSGSGKSTILRLIAGLEKPDSGEIIINGTDCTRKHPSKRGIGMVFQQTALFPHLNVLRNVVYGLENRSYSKDEKLQKAEKILSLLGLSGFENRNVQTLSGGESQRVSLARTLIMEPSVILFDEPFSSLDQSLKIQLRNEIKKLQKELNFTGIFVTHDMEEACFISDYMGIMKKGRIIAMGETQNLFLKPGNVETLDFLNNGFIISGKEISGKKVKKSDNYCNTQQKYIVISTGFLPNMLKEDSSVRKKIQNSHEMIYTDESTFSFYATCVKKDFYGFSNKVTFEKNGEYFDLSLPVSAKINEKSCYRLFFDINSVKEI